MKQSQNAITFLRAQYSAVYGHAYIKGLASAMVVTSALAGAYAQEAGAIEVVGGKSWEDVKDYDTVSNQAQARDNLDDGYYRNLTVQSGDTLGIRDIFLKGELDIKDGGSASLTGSAGRDLYGWNNVLDSQTSDASTGATGSLISHGSFSVGADGQTLSGVKSSHAHFKDILLGSGSNSKTFIRGLVDSNQSIEDYSTLAGGYAGGKVAVESGNTVFLKNNVQFKVAKGSSGSFDGRININANQNGVNSFIRGEDNYDGSWTSGGAAKLIFGEHSYIQVFDGDGDLTTHGMGGIYAADTELNGKIEIKDNASLTLDGDFIDTKKDASSAGHGAGKFVAGDTATFNVEEGSRLIVGSGAYASDNSGSLDVDESKLKTSLDLTKVQKGNLRGDGALEVRGSVALTESVLNYFVSPK